MLQENNCVDFFSKLILRELYNEKIECWIAGGCLRAYCGRETINDIDLFFPNKQEYDKAVLFILKQGGEKIFENDNVIKITYKNNIFDFVKKYFDSPIETINNFDFTVVCAYIHRGSFRHHETFYIDLAKKQLMINSLPFPNSTLWRMQKYIQKGYVICKEELLKIIKEIKTIELDTDSDSNTWDRSSFNGIY